MTLLIGILCWFAPQICTLPEFPVVGNPIEAVGSRQDPPPGPVEQWKPLVAKHFPASQVNRALCIIRHESNGNPSADNPSSSARGLFQILGSLWRPHYNLSYGDLYDPEINTRVARLIWNDYGWWAWSPYKRGECQ